MEYAVATTSPAELLFSTYRRRILALLLLRPQEGFHVREISRLTGIPAGSLHRELKLLAQSGLLLRQPMGNQIRYQANPDCPIYPELAGIFRKTVGFADVLRDALLPLGNAVELAFVFGSLAQGKERVTSDADVFVVGTASFDKVVDALSQTHEQLGREINPVVTTSAALREKCAEGDRFTTRVMQEPKLFFIGTDRDFGKLAQDWTTEAARS